MVEGVEESKHFPACWVQEDAGVGKVWCREVVDSEMRVDDSAYSEDIEDIYVFVDLRRMVDVPQC